MDLWDKKDSANKFFDWSDRVISRQDLKLKKILAMKKSGDNLINDDYLPTRYMLDGNECSDEWPNFQLDGYGTWLWTLSEHIKLTENNHLINKYKNSIKIAIDYLSNFWNYPNFDCWQENGERVHTATLASIYGGLKAINEYIKDENVEETVKVIKQYVLDNCLEDGRLKKCIDLAAIDANLLWTAIPFKLFEVNDLIIEKTVKAIEDNLVHNGGVHRYPEDTYYGGGEWIVLSAWLGLYYCQVKELDKAKEMLAWIESKANNKGELAEQSLEHVNNKNYISKWKSLWGEVASPVLWSHAMYLILVSNIIK
jgi:GH15 family glucan-1,4-alpha-glucosidase